MSEMCDHPALIGDGHGRRWVIGCDRCGGAPRINFARMTAEAAGVNEKPRETPEDEGHYRAVQEDSLRTHAVMMAGLLEVAVPMWIERFRALTPSHRLLVARTAAAEVAWLGDVLHFGGSKSARAGDVFNDLARGLAAAAYQPGGVWFLDKHWEAQP